MRTSFAGVGEAEAEALAGYQIVTQIGQSHIEVLEGFHQTNNIFDALVPRLPCVVAL
jgi:hypothetical protein